MPLSDYIDSEATNLISDDADGRNKSNSALFTAEQITRLISTATILIFAILWWTLTELHLVTSLFLPAPNEVIDQFVAVIEDGYANAPLTAHLAASLSRIAVAAIIAFCLAVPIGILMGLSPLIKGVFDPPIEFYWPLPPLSYLPLMII